MNWNEPIDGAPDFKWGEFFVTGESIGLLRGEWSRSGDLNRSLSMENLRHLARKLQVIRDFFRAPVTITSGWRSQRLNDEIGGEQFSYHLRGMAADIVVVGFTPKLVQDDLKNWHGGMGGYATFTHLDIGPKRRWKG